MCGQEEGFRAGELLLRVLDDRLQRPGMERILRLLDSEDVRLWRPFQCHEQGERVQHAIGDICLTELSSDPTLLERQGRTGRDKADRGDILDAGIDGL